MGILVGLAGAQHARVAQAPVPARLAKLVASTRARAAQAPAHAPARAAKLVAPGSPIVRDPRDLPPPVGARPPEVVRVLLTAHEIVEPLDPATGVSYSYWTFNDHVPGPMIRVRVGDTVELTLYNNPGNRMVHSIDIHAALGPGGGAEMMQVPPAAGDPPHFGRRFTFIATTPGLFVYHCGTPVVAEHIANGMYGLILVEPAGGLPRVDHEYYVMQGEIYTSGPGRRGQTLALDERKLMAESPRLFVFNGAVGALTTEYPLTAKVGQSVRIFFGNAGPNATSSPHVIGEIFTRYYPFGSLESPPLRGVQTGTVPPGAAAILELRARMPGRYILVDHAIARVQKGLAAYLNVTGKDVAHLMYPGPDELSAPIPDLAMTAADSRQALDADFYQPPAPTAAEELAGMLTAATKTTRVTMTSMRFVPAIIAVSPGEAVTWENTSAVIHTVVDDAGVALNRDDVALPAGAAAFTSPFLQPGQSYTRVFTVPGIYRYVCTQHEREGMVATVVVRAEKPKLLLASRPGGARRRGAARGGSR